MLMYLYPPYRESGVGLKLPLMRAKSEDSGGSTSPKLRSTGIIQRQHVFHTSADVSDIHICVLCLKALMNNAVSVYIHAW